MRTGVGMSVHCWAVRPASDRAEGQPHAGASAALRKNSTWRSAGSRAVAVSSGSAGRCGQRMRIVASGVNSSQTIHSAVMSSRRGRWCRGGAAAGRTSRPCSWRRDSPGSGRSSGSVRVVGGVGCGREDVGQLPAHGPFPRADASSQGGPPNSEGIGPGPGESVSWRAVVMLPATTIGYLQRDDVEADGVADAELGTVLAGERLEELAGVGHARVVEPAQILGVGLQRCDAALEVLGDVHPV